MNNISNVAKLGECITFGDGIVIKDGAIIENNVVICDNVVIGQNVTIQKNLRIGAGTKIWDNSFIRSSIGEECVIARGVFIDTEVPIGNRVKIQNRNNITHGVILEDGVFVGPNVTFSNDKYPRSINLDESLKSGTDWICSKTEIKKGAALGAGCVIVCGVRIGEWAMVGAGAVVTKDVPNYAMVTGNPARIIKWVSKSGYPMSFIKSDKKYAYFFSSTENKEYKIPIRDCDIQIE
ncbi:MAG: N-acetyltransferase [Prevotella sp.]|nr:N-acetyltransferase [Prevotella sp.]